MIETVLAVDIGTTSLKAGLFTAEGEVVSFYKTSFSNPQNRFVAESWLWALKAAVDKLDKENFSIVAVSISGNGPTVVSDTGMTLRWNEEVSNLPLFENQEIRTKSLFIPKIKAFQILFPEEYQNSKFIYSGPEFLIYKLTGCAVTVLPEKRYMTAYWTSEELSKFNLSCEKMPPYVSIGEKCGNLQKSVSEFLKLPADIPVFSAGPDFIAALIGTNTLSVGKLCNRSGSSEGFNYCSNKLIFAEGIRTLPSVIPDLWNLSALMVKSSSIDENERLEKVSEAVESLKAVLIANELPVPSEMVVTGGQTLDKKYMQKKAEKLGMNLKVCRCSDSELTGDACAAWFGLGKYSSLAEAAGKMI